MKKYLLSATVPMLAFVAGAVTFMQVKTTDGEVIVYDVDNVEQIDYENAGSDTYYMRTKKTDGTVEKFNTEKITEVDYVEKYLLQDTTGNAQGVSVSGEKNGFTYVDLGLKNGTLWATYNVGATAPTENGDFFAWGETEPKASYTWDTYKWCNGTEKSLTKYCSYSDYGKVDNKGTIEPEDDAATANWGDSWRMPTSSELSELMSGCTWEWTTDFNGSGIAGVIGTSKTNDSTIFLPASSYYDDTTHVLDKPSNAILSATVSRTPSIVEVFYYPNGNVGMQYTHRRYGRSVRAVVDQTVRYTVKFYDVDSTLIKVQKVLPGERAVAPQGYVFTLWNTSLYNVQTDLNIYAVKTPAPMDTVMDKGVESDHEYVNLGLPSGTLWATTNVGSAKPQDNGQYFSWGETASKKNYEWTTYKYCDGDYNNQNKYCMSSDRGKIDNKPSLEDIDDVALQQWGGRWRMPTSKQVSELVKNCYWEWTDNYNGTQGYIVYKAKKEEDKGVRVGCRDVVTLSYSVNDDLHIFLPTAGSMSGKYNMSIDVNGLYWMRNLDTYDNDKAYVLNFYCSEVEITTSPRYQGKTIRPVIQGELDLW